MKKHFTSLILISLYAFCNAFSQGITLTYANNAFVAGDSYTLLSCDTTGVLTGSTGTNQTWNFTNLVILSGSSVTSNFVTLASTSWSSSFPGSTVVKSDGGAPLFFYNYTNNQSEYLGYYDPGIISSPFMNGTVKYTDTDIKFKYPFSYGSNYNDTYAGNETNGLTTFTGTTTTIADGWGTLMLPNNKKYINVLRIRKSINTTIGSASKIENNYSWYNGMTKFPILYISNTAYYYNGSTTYTNKVQVSSTVLGIENYNEIGWNVYPNPVNDILTIETNANKEHRIEIINLIGQSIYASNFYSKVIIDVSLYPKGVYIIKLSNDKETITKKFIKE